MIQGVRDPLGGIKSLWPLFGIANQLLAAIALCSGDDRDFENAVSRVQGPKSKSKVGKPIFALVALVPLLWLLSVTMTAGWQKIFSDDSNIGFISAARGQDAALPGLQAALDAAKTSNAGYDAIKAAAKAVSDNRKTHFNNELDVVVAAFFMVMVLTIAAISAWEWLALLTRKRAAVLRESEPVWLPEYAVAESKPLPVMGLVAIGFGLARELSGEAHMERAQQMAISCPCASKTELSAQEKSACAKTSEQLYVEMTEKRFKGINRCC